MQVKLVRAARRDGTKNWSLTLCRIYTVLGIEGDWYRLLDDTNKPHLFDPACFEITDPTEPDFWVSEITDDGERYCYPSEWSTPGFFEDYFDKDPAAQEAFRQAYERHYAIGE